MQLFSEKCSYMEWTSRKMLFPLLWRENSNKDRHVQKNNSWGFVRQRYDTSHSGKIAPHMENSTLRRGASLFSFISMKSCWKMNEKTDVPDIFRRTVLRLVRLEKVDLSRPKKAGLVIL